MLDIFMLMFMLAALWQLAAALRSERHVRWRLAAAGMALGLSLACKWSGASVALIPGTVLLALRIRQCGWRFLYASDAGPLRGVSLLEAAFWLGLLPLATYAATFAPAFFYADKPLTLARLVPFQLEMLDMQGIPKRPHPYRSVWYDWVLNNRSIWYLYDRSNGPLRAVMLIGNPLTMLLGLPALVWCGWTAWRRRNSARAAAVLFYGASMVMWVVAPKPVQFYFHYMLPSCFLLAALALALDDLWQRGHRWLPLGVLVAAGLVFAWFHPVLSAAQLHGGKAFPLYGWIPGWR
jgi:dolichyl-phosphate-mannose-protein mannosyltransferase